MRVVALVLLTLLIAPLASQAQEVGGARKGYMIVIGNGVDPARMGEYARAAVPLLLEYQGRLLFTTDEGATEVIEGGPFPGSIRVFEFPSLQSARDFYFSDRYQQAIPLRAGNGQLEVLLADGFVPDPKWAQPAAAGHAGR